MTFQKGNKFGLKKPSEYVTPTPEATTIEEDLAEPLADPDDVEELSPPKDEEEVVVKFQSQYPEGQGEVSEPPLDKAEAEDMPAMTTAIQRELESTVCLKYHGALKDNGEKIFQRPIPQISKHVDKGDVVRIGADRLGLFTKKEAEYLLTVCKGAFTKV